MKLSINFGGAVHDQIDVVEAFHEFVTATTFTIVYVHDDDESIHTVYHQVGQRKQLRELSLEPFLPNTQQTDCDCWYTGPGKVHQYVKEDLATLKSCVDLLGGPAPLVNYGKVRFKLDSFLETLAREPQTSILWNTEKFSTLIALFKKIFAENSCRLWLPKSSKTQIVLIDVDQLPEGLRHLLWADNAIATRMAAQKEGYVGLTPNALKIWGRLLSEDLGGFNNLGPASKKDTQQTLDVASVLYRENRTMEAMAAIETARSITT